MPIPSRTVTLTAAASPDSVHVYTKTADGVVREATNTISDKAILDAIKSESIQSLDLTKEWAPGKSFHCDLSSVLCAVSWGDEAPSVFFQDRKGDIRQRRMDSNSNLTSFEEHSALKGTNIAAVYSDDGNKLMLFFQDTKRYVCYRSATRAAGGSKWQWTKSAVAISNVKACNGTGIGATAWNDLGNIRVYLQDEKKVVREFYGSFGKREWEACGFSKHFGITIGDITAISWNNNGAQQMRLYLQDEHNTVIEWAHDGNRWMRGDFMAAALPNADVIAFVRNVGTKADPTYVPNIFWVGQDQVLYQRICIANASGYRWLDIVPIVTIRSAGAQEGSWIGSHFTDENDQDPDTPDRIIRAIRVKATKHIVAIALDFTDGTSTSWHGGDHGDIHEFVLEAGENIHQVWRVANEQRILGLSFGTSKERTSPWYGSSGSSEQVSVWEHQGYALAGFAGAAGDAVFGLMPLWSDRLAYATMTSIDEILKEGNSLKQDVEKLSKKLPGLEADCTALSTSIEIGYTDRASATVSAFVELAVSTEYLSDLECAKSKARLVSQSSDERRRQGLNDQLQVCQGQTKGLLDLVNSLFTKAKELNVSSKALHTKAVEIDDDIRTIETRLHRILEGTEIEAGKEYNLVLHEDAQLNKAKTDLDEAKKSVADLERRLQEETQRPSTKKPTPGGLLDRSRQKPLIFSYDAMDIPMRLALAKKLVEQNEKFIPDCSQRLATARENLQKFIQVHAEASATFLSIKDKMAELRPVINQDKVLREACDRLSASLERLRVSSVAMEDNTAATEYAEELLVVLSDLLAIDVLKTQFAHEQSGIVGKVLRAVADAVY